MMMIKSVFKLYYIMVLNDQLLFSHSYNIKKKFQLLEVKILIKLFICKLKENQI